MDARPTTPLWFQRVQALLDERGWTQRRLAALAIVKHPDCGVTEPRLSKWRAGQGSIYLSQIEAIADALEVDVGDLVGQKRNGPEAQRSPEELVLDRLIARHGAANVLAKLIEVGMGPKTPTDPGKVKD